MQYSSGGNTSAAAVLIIVAFAALLYSVNAYFRRDRRPAEPDEPPRHPGLDAQPRRRPAAGRSGAWWVGGALAVVLVVVAIALRR